MDYAFHVYNKLAADGAAMALDRLLRETRTQKEGKTRGAGLRLSQNCERNEGRIPPPVVVCIGSDLAIGDSLGPIVGSMLKYKTQGVTAYLYGTLSSPITAKEVGYLPAFLEETHPRSPIIAVDAAVGEKGDIGLIKLADKPLLPGAGANKRLGKVGDVSVMGIVAEKSANNYGLLNTTRLNLVYTMSEIISDALSGLLWNIHAKTRENA